MVQNVLCHLFLLMHPVAKINYNFREQFINILVTESPSAP